MGKMHDALFAAKLAGGSGGSGGTSDYSDLINKPSINSVTLSGNKTSSDLGLQATLTFDTTPTQGSSNPVTSDGVYTEIAAINATIGNINTVLEGVL